MRNEVNGSEKRLTYGNKPAVVLHSLVGAASRVFLLVLFSHLGCLPSNFPCSGKGTMNLTYTQLGDSVRMKK